MGARMTEGGAMRIEFIFDTVCPWCFIGKRRLERALARRPGVPTKIIWRPFLLNPDMPEGGISRATYLERKFGGAARVARMLGSLSEAGQAEGIFFDFSAIARTPNSVQAHRLIRLADRQGLANAMVEALFSAYFEHGRDIGHPAVLADLAGRCGLSEPDMDGWLAGSDGRGEVFMDNAQTHRLSINGVPCFVFDGAYGIAGAQDPDILGRMIDLACDRRLEAPLSQRAASDGM